jgi:flagellar hook assembly protein FlgD
VDWLTEPLSPAHDIPDRTSYITAVSPNPFNPRLTVSFIVPVQQQATITVCDLAGKRVATLSDEVFTAGEHQVVWDGQDDDGRALPSGGYFIHLVSGGASQTRKAMLVR